MRRRFFSLSKSLRSSELVFAKISSVLLESSNCRCCQLNTNLLTVNDEGFLLEIWLPDFWGGTHRVAHVVAKLLTFSCDVAFVRHSKKFLTQA